MTGGGRLLRHPLAVVGAYLALAVLVTWPLVLDPSGTIAGGARTDALNSVWNLWFVEQAVRRGELPLHTLLLDHPSGGRIAVADPINALLGLPLTAAFGPVAAYGALVIGHLTAAGIAAHALGRRLGGGGWVAGVGYTLAPIVLSHVHNGSSETVSAGWLPLAALGVVGLAEHGWGGPRGWLRGSGAAVGLACCAIAGWYAGIGAFILAGCIAVLGWRSVAPARTLARLVPAIAVAVVLVAPVAYATKQVAQSEDGLVDIKNPEDLARIRRTLGAADPRVFVVPGDFRSPDFARDTANPNDRVHTAYLGFVLIFAAMWRGHRDLALWVAGGAGLVLAMGPVVVLDGFPASAGGRALPLPYAALEPLPGFDALSLLYRLATVGALCLAVIADRAPRWVALLVALEVRFASSARGLPHVVDVPVTDAVAELRDRPDGAVLNLPVQAGRNFLFEQTIHGKPVCGSLNSGANRAGLRVLLAARKMRAGELTKAELVAVARQEGVRYVVVHKNMLAAETFVPATTGIRRAFVAVAEDERTLVYALW